MNTQLVIDKITQNKTILRRTLQSEYGRIDLLFVKQMIDTDKLSLYVLKPLLQYWQEQKQALSLAKAFSEILQVEDCTVFEMDDKMVDHILDGQVLLLFAGEPSYIKINLKNVQKKSVSPPELTDALNAPKDSFTENLEVNLSLLRYRIKDNQLRLDNIIVGEHTQTSLAVAYLEGIADPHYVRLIENRLKRVKVNGIVASGQLQKYIADQQLSLFPQSGLIERSDMAAQAILNGKIVIMVEGSGIALVTPKVFRDFLLASDDTYGNVVAAGFTRFIRVLSLVVSLIMTPLYVAVVTFHTEILPSVYILSLAAGRANVVFSALLEALLLELLQEVLREALTRVPKNIGSAVGIVGGIVIGQAAVSVGIFSPLLLILSSLSLLTSFVAPDYTISVPFRILKFGLILLTGVLGLFGFAVGIFLITVFIISSSSVGVAYFSPYAPHGKKG